ncbi:MAG TPA: MEDS domain-containing protein [Polyangia bacterium]|nr:MEDS domain-containing protein [Polyangia bacterium]
MDLSTSTLGGLRASGHLCFPYETEDERRRTVVAFVREGLARRERCLYIAAEAEQRAFRAELEAAGVDATREVGRGALVLAAQGETYLRSGRFDPDDALALMESLTDRALADGFVGLRATAEASSRALDDLWPLVLRYEALLNERLARRPFVGLCRFRAAELAPDRLRDVLRTHPEVLVRGEACANPFYEHAEVVLGGDDRAHLDWQLHQLRSYQRERKRLEAGTRAALEARARAARERDRFLAVLAEELADPLFALKREVHAMGAALDETPAAERLEAAQRHLRRLSAAVDHAREVARAAEAEAGRDEEPAEDAAATPRRPRG